MLCSCDRVFCRFYSMFWFCSCYHSSLLNTIINKEKKLVKQLPLISQSQLDLAWLPGRQHHMTEGQCSDEDLAALLKRTQRTDRHCVSRESELKRVQHQRGT
ncbi:hypothetical protein CRENBAI_015519 [Crenichthys baileyi]|uniref:Uncharacterized protein n=1 Tax=Crenichthys baileyi TaxID=28760 RepID=A0AAV9SER3_9TELE